MTLTHRLYLLLLTGIIILSLALLIYKGFSFYAVSLEERFYHPDYATLKPSGFLGHGYGILGSLLMILGVVLYSARKRIRTLARLGVLKHWLEFHIFLCTLGPAFVLFHTSFKFGGLVAISFWSMVAVFLSGVAGRFIYIQIPRTIEGEELSLNEVRSLKKNIGETLNESYKLDEETIHVILDSTKNKVEKYHANAVARWVNNMQEDRRSMRKIKTTLRRKRIPRADTNNLVKMAGQEINLNRKIDRLVVMQNLFKYWHVAHLPFALVMLIIMIIHTVVTILFGYRWIF